MPRLTKPSPTSYGPALGNVPAPDAYLRLKQNVDGLTKEIGNVKSSIPGPNLTDGQLQQAQQALQANGKNPLNLLGLLGAPSNVAASINTLTGAIVIVNGTGIAVVVNAVTNTITISLSNVGPGAGTYTVGAKLTGGGTNGTITIDAQGRITAISPAT